MGRFDSFFPRKSLPTGRWCEMMASFVTVKFPSRVLFESVNSLRGGEYCHACRTPLQKLHDYLFLSFSIVNVAHNERGRNVRGDVRPNTV